MATQANPSTLNPSIAPPLLRSSTAPNNLLKPRTTPSFLTPEDAFLSPRHRYALNEATRHQKDVQRLTGDRRDEARGRSFKNKDRDPSSSRRRKGTWKKLLWVKQSYNDNYTDQETFLEQLQRNPRLQPYDFWPLVADSTVIVQHVCSVVIFIICFVGIFQERVSPVAVVSWSTGGTVLGWVLWDYWVGQEEAMATAQQDLHRLAHPNPTTSRDDSGIIYGSQTSLNMRANSHAHSTSTSSITSLSTPISPNSTPDSPTNFIRYMPHGSRSSFSLRNQQRLATLKSAILIYCALLGLSPILKSLTKSTSSDSIWAMSAWLMIINVFFFDYGSPVVAKFPASLSTNAALMASTVLASRLPSTEHVFSLTLFSIEVFGLFPVFRRHLQHISWRGHLVLTAVLVMGAWGGVGVVASGGGWKSAIVGVTLGLVGTVLVMGGCSWWLIGLQKYKNEIHGPWDPARPIIRRAYDE